MAKSKSSERILCFCGCKTYVSRRTQTRHLQGKGPTLALAEMFETQTYFGMHTKGHGIDDFNDPDEADARPPKRPQIEAKNHGPSLTHPPLHLDLNLHALPQLPNLAINPDDVLASRWAQGLDSGYTGDSEDEITDDFDGPQLMEVSDDEEEGFESDLEDWWDDKNLDDVFQVLETDIELDACGAGVSLMLIPRFALLLMVKIFIGRESLGVGVLDELKLFALKLREPITERVLEQISRLSSYNVQSLHHMKRLVDRLSELNAVDYHCCVKSCIAFTGPHTSLTSCPRCDEPQYRSDGKCPRKVFRYLPLIPRLLAFFLNHELNECMNYRAEGHPKAKEDSGGLMTDVFDSSHYRGLLKRNVTIDGHCLGHKYFEDP